MFEIKTHDLLFQFWVIKNLHLNQLESETNFWGADHLD